MSKLIFILLLSPMLCFSQSRKERGEIHAFTGYSMNDITPFYSYLINDLDYKTPTGTVEIAKTKTGYSTNFNKWEMGYDQHKKVLKVDFVCNKDGVIKSATITGPFSLLAELYIKYFEGTVKEDFPKAGGIDKTYTATDEVKLFVNAITIKPHNNIFSSK
jgi:hypothetical protein